MAKPRAAARSRARARRASPRARRRVHLSTRPPRPRTRLPCPLQDAPSIPVLRAPADVLRGGERTLAVEAKAAHPVEVAQARGAALKLEGELYRLERVYGKHAAWERRMDLAAAAATARLPGLPSSHAALDTLLGRDATIAFEDVLNGARQTRGAAGGLLAAE